MSSPGDVDGLAQPRSSLSDYAAGLGGADLSSEVRRLRESLTAGRGSVTPPGPAGSYTRFAPEHWQWQLRDDSYYAELCTFLAFCDDGSFVLANISVVSLGRLAHHKVNVVFKHTPSAAAANDTTTTTFKESYAATDLVRSEEGQTLSVGPHSVAATYTETGSAAFKVKLTFAAGYTGAGGCEVDMTCTGLASGYTPGIDPNGWRYGETGEQLFMGFAAPRGVVTGTAAYDGVVTELAGAGFVSKNRTNLQAHLQASTAYHCKFFSRDTTLQLIMLLPPGHVTKGNRALISGCIMHEGKLLHCTLDGDSYAYSDDAAEKDPVTGYHQPTKLYYHWEGQTIEEPPRKISCSLEIATDSTPMIVMDVLDHLPWILRKIVQAFFARPFLYLYYKENVAATLRIGDTELITTGKCLFEKHFINPQS